MHVPIQRKPLKGRAHAYSGASAMNGRIKRRLRCASLRANKEVFPYLPNLECFPLVYVTLYPAWISGGFEVITCAQLA